MFSWILPVFFLLVLTRFEWISLGVTGFYWVFYQVFLGSSGWYQVIPGVEPNVRGFWGAFSCCFRFFLFFSSIFCFFLDRYTAVSGDVTMRTSGQTAGATVSDLTKKTKQKTVGKRRKRERERERERTPSKRFFYRKWRTMSPLDFPWLEPFHLICRVSIFWKKGKRNGSETVPNQSGSTASRS